MSDSLQDDQTDSCTASQANALFYISYVFFLLQVVLALSGAADFVERHLDGVLCHRQHQQQQQQLHVVYDVHRRRFTADHLAGRRRR